MPLGPVFNAELMTTARRSRYYILRFVYGLLVLVQIYSVYNTWSWRLNRGDRQLSIREMSQFAVTIFSSFAFLQAAVVLLLTPALVGGTIADERQRKTLHYLLTSQLSGGEIVLGKLAARLLQLGVFVAMGLPVVSLIGLFGGVDPLLIAATYGGTATSMYFLATMSILVSVRSRSPRDAVASLYLLGIAWLLNPVLLASFTSLRAGWWLAISPWIWPVLEWVAISSPLYLIPGLPIGGKAPLYESTLWVMGMQVVYGTIMATLAAFQLRPAFRKIEDRGTTRFAWVRKLTAKRSWLSRPACGDDGMLWKERHVSRTGGMAKATSLIFGLLLFGLMIWSGYYFVEPVVIDILANGWSDLNSSARRDLHGFIIGVSVAIYVIWSLGLASAAASGVTSEREGDTWLSLTATPLSGQEILRAKMIGAAWSLRILVYLLLTVWAIGLVLGVLHPIGVIFCAAEFALFSWFTIALGTTISLRSRNSTRALAGTVLTLMIVNGGYLFCCIPFRANTPLILIGCSPAIFGGSLFNYDMLGNLLTGSSRRMYGPDTAETIMAGVLCVIGYAIAAAALTAYCFSAFDAVVERPDRFAQPTFRPPAKPKPKSGSPGVLE